MEHIERLYKQYKQDVYYFLISLTHNPLLAEDLLSETFLKAIYALPRFENKSSIRTWLFGIARNLWLQHLRKEKSNINFDDLLGLYVREDIVNHFINEEIVRRIDQLLSTKDERSKSIVYLRVDGYSFAVIAENVNITESSARVIEFRTKKWLKAQLEKEGLM